MHRIPWRIAAFLLVTLALIVGLSQAASAADTDGIDIRLSSSSYPGVGLEVCRHGVSDCDEDYGLIQRGQSTGDFWSNPEAKGFWLPPGFYATVTNNSGVSTQVNEPGWRILRYDSSPKIVRLFRR